MQNNSTTPIQPLDAASASKRPPAMQAADSGREPKINRSGGKPWTGRS